MSLRDSPRYYLIEGLVTAAAVAAVSTAAGVLLHAQWPATADAWFSFTLLKLIELTLFLLVWLMARRTQHRTRLGASIIWFHTTKVFLWVVIDLYTVFPTLRITWPWLGSWVLRLVVLSGCLWALFEMAHSKDPPMLGTEREEMREMVESDDR